ncbi:hypothetical protein [Sphingomonas bacterium]|uniref:hypothetical protein n=1 Tax=Sphingomonas bacterium TaxID=1895847 RepID=UPI0015770007|nr:hypothetical protein [Sphingomonas bacterium]
MQALLILGLQIAPVLGSPVAILSKLSAVPTCPEANDPADIVVCGHVDTDRYRLRPLTPPLGVRDGPPLAQTGIGGGTLGVTTQQVMIGNVPSNRVMLSLKLPF